jgi:hypothetical protein
VPGRKHVGDAAPSDAVKSVSPTAGSWRLPRASIIVLALVLAGDRLVFELDGVWDTLDAAAGPTNVLASDVATSQVRLRTVAEAPGGDLRVFVVGSSRAEAGFDPVVARQAIPHATFATIAQGGLGPFELSAYVAEMIAARPHLVILLLSEFETHRPLRLEPVPATGSASVGAVADLVAETGPAFAFRHRTTLARVLLASVLNTYRFKNVLNGAGAERARTFPLDRRLPRKRPGSFGRPVALRDGTRTALPAPEREAIRRRLGQGSRMRFIALGMLADVSTGHHARVQLGLVRRAIERFQRRGIEVAVVEPPLHPAAAPAVNPAACAEFEDFARALVRTHGITFVGLEEIEPFEDGDFSDLLHLTRAGARKLTAGVLRVVERTAARRSGAAAGDEEARGSRAGRRPPLAALGLARASRWW